VARGWSFVSDIPDQQLPGRFVGEQARPLAAVLGDLLSGSIRVGSKWRLG
jgi:hypothetical protein